MLPAQRLQNILEDIKTDGVYSVGELSQKYDVSEMTIRRDLKLLEDQGLITRTHGGAVIKPSSSVELQFTQKRGINEAQKRQIARYAVEHFLKDNDIIAIEGGTTVTGMVAYMTGYRNITVMTNGMHTLLDLQRISAGNTVISTGGLLREVSNTLVGPVAEDHFKTFNASKFSFRLPAGLKNTDSPTRICWKFRSRKP
ncbi:MAG: DeoR/GlpR family DNA-binding transcription regulator [Chloroflexota bacterium]